MAFPLCLQQHKEDAGKSAVITNNQQEDQWPSSTHKGLNFNEKSLSFSPPPPSHFCHHFLSPKHKQQSPKEYQFWASNEPEPEPNDAISKPDLLSNPNSSPNSASSSEVEEDNTGDLQCHHLKEFNPQNMKLIAEALLKTVPNCPKDKASEISAKILQRRSQKRQQSCSLLFNGQSQEAKERTAREFAKLFFGSQTRLVSIGLSSFKDGEFGQKRGRFEMGCSYLQRFAEAVNENPHRVFLMEDFEQIDHCSLKGLKEAIEKGRVRLEDGEICPLKDAIVIFNGEMQIVKQELQSEEEEEEEEENRSGLVSLDLNIAIVEHGNGDRFRSIVDCVDGKILFS